MSCVILDHCYNSIVPWFFLFTTSILVPMRCKPRLFKDEGRCAKGSCWFTRRESGMRRLTARVGASLINNCLSPNICVTVSGMRIGWLVILLSASLAAQAGIKTDGTLRPTQTLAGPQFAVTPDLGRQVGGNLFHSFAEFNLAAGE